jgi:hypothetical protein
MRAGTNLLRLGSCLLAQSAIRNPQFAIKIHPGERLMFACSGMIGVATNLMPHPSNKIRPGSNLTVPRTNQAHGAADLILVGKDKIVGISGMICAATGTVRRCELYGGGR